MNARIEFLPGFAETKLPIIRLTKSRDKTTGTATFIFIRPHLFELIQKEFIIIKEMTLIWEQKKISTNDIEIIFNKGKPLLIKSIFIFKNPSEWFQFLNFMQIYSKTTGLFFTELE